MLHSLRDFTGASIIEPDGELGKVRDFLFDDQSWAIRYLTVDVGSWVIRRNIVISLSAVDKPEWSKKTIHTNLTREQVRHSPDVDSNKPVSRQQEIAMSEYYGWPAYWEHERNTELPAISIPAGREYPVHTREDPHLRSVAAVSGYSVWADDSELGRVEDFIIDDSSWHIGYLDVMTGDWLHSRSVLVPTGWVTSLSWAHHRVKLRHMRK